MTLNNYVQVACLPDSSKLVYPNMSGIQGYIAGWGATSLVGELAIYATRLQNTNVTIYEMSSCSNVQSSLPKIVDAQICAGDISGARDSCYGKYTNKIVCANLNLNLFQNIIGDSGGPLYTKEKVNEQNKYILAGITSYGESCAERDKPG